MNKYLITLLSSAFLFRLGLSFFAVNPDIISQSYWGETVFHSGPYGLYDDQTWVREWPSQPPLAMLIYGFTLNIHGAITHAMSSIGNFIAFNHLGAGHLLFYYNFVSYFGDAVLFPDKIHIGQIIVIKMLASLADLLIAAGIYFFLIKKNSKSSALLVTGLFLFLPFSWYLSSLWGQFDQLATLVLAVSIFLLYKKQFVISALLFFAAFQIKPTMIFFSLFYLYYFVCQKPKIREIIFSLLGLVVANFIITIPFIGTDSYFDKSKDIYYKIFLVRREASLVSHAFNFWQFFYPNGLKISSGSILFWMGHLFTLLITFIGLFVFKPQKSLKNLLISAYFVTAGSFLFGIGMLDRYFFPAIVFLALNIAFSPKLFWPWVVTCMFYFLNLFLSWGYPFPILEQGQAWIAYQNSVRMLSLAQIALFIICLNIMFDHAFSNYVNNVLKFGKIHLLWQKAN